MPLLPPAECSVAGIGSKRVDPTGLGTRAGVGRSSAVLGSTGGEADTVLARTGDAFGQQHVRASVEDGDLTELQRHEEQVKEAPARWLPWNS